MTKTARYFVLCGLALFFGACDATAQLAQCTPDDPTTTLDQVSSKDCNTGNICNKYEIEELGGSVRLCADPTNLCGNTAIQEACKALGKVCVVVDGANNAKMAKCAVPASPCGTNNGGCTGTAICKIASDGSTFCDEPAPAGTCSKHTDCTAAQYCNFATSKCEVDHKSNEMCDVGPTSMMPGLATPEECVSNICLSDLRCGCRDNNDCATNYICNSQKRCVVDPTKADVDVVEMCMTCNDPLGCRALGFDNSTLGYVTSSVYARNVGDKSCVTFKYRVCSVLSIPLKAAAKGPVSLSSSTPYQLPADKRIAGVQLQMCDSETPNGDCYAGSERGDQHMLKNAVSAISVRNLITGRTVQMNLASDLYVTAVNPADGKPITSSDGNLVVTPEQMDCSKVMF